MAFGIALAEPATLMVGGTAVTAEVADTPQRRAQGLMGRFSLAPNAGMLFVYPDEAVRSFWMKNTPLPLSIAYMKSGQIVHRGDDAAERGARVVGSSHDVRPRDDPRMVCGSRCEGGAIGVGASRTRSAMSQRTLASVAEAAGVALHCGAHTRVRMCPAPVDSGRRFVVGGVEIPVAVDRVTDTQLATTLGDGSACVRTVGTS